MSFFSPPQFWPQSADIGTTHCIAASVENVRVSAASSNPSPYRDCRLPRRSRADCELDACVRLAAYDDARQGAPSRLRSPSAGVRAVPRAACRQRRRIRKPGVRQERLDHIHDDVVNDDHLNCDELVHDDDYPDEVDVHHDRAGDHLVDHDHHDCAADDVEHNHNRAGPTVDYDHDDCADEVNADDRVEHHHHDDRADDDDRAEHDYNDCADEVEHVLDVVDHVDHCGVRNMHGKQTRLYAV